MGVYSSAIFEGITYPLHTFIVDLPGWENMDLLMERMPGVFQITDAGQLAAYLRELGPPDEGRPVEQLFTPNAPGNIRTALESILSKGTIQKEKRLGSEQA